MSMQHEGFARAAGAVKLVLKREVARVARLEAGEIVKFRVFEVGARLSTVRARLATFGPRPTLRVSRKAAVRRRSSSITRRGRPVGRCISAKFATRRHETLEFGLDQLTSRDERRFLTSGDEITCLRGDVSRARPQVTQSSRLITPRFLCCSGRPGGWRSVATDVSVAAPADSSWRAIGAWHEEHSRGKCRSCTGHSFVATDEVSCAASRLPGGLSASHNRPARPDDAGGGQSAPGWLGCVAVFAPQFRPVRPSIPPRPRHRRALDPVRRTPVGERR